jgi:hypothetical protein
MLYMQDFVISATTSLYIYFTLISIPASISEQICPTTPIHTLGLAVSRCSWELGHSIAIWKKASQQSLLTYLVIPLASMF